MRVTKTHFHFPASGGERSAAHGLLIPDTARGLDWDPETLTLAYTVPAEVEGSEASVHEISVTQEQIDDALASANAPRPASVPQRVSKAQLKIALLMESIDLPALVAQLPADKQAIANILIADAEYFDRSAVIVDDLSALAGLTSAQVDNLFRVADQIDPASL